MPKKFIDSRKQIKEGVINTLCNKVIKKGLSFVAIPGHLQVGA